VSGVQVNEPAERHGLGHLAMYLAFDFIRIQRRYGDTDGVFKSSKSGVDLAGRNIPSGTHQISWLVNKRTDKDLTLRIETCLIGYQYRKSSHNVDSSSTYISECFVLRFEWKSGSFLVGIEAEDHFV
jgi:hypothetical protein